MAVANATVSERPRASVRAAHQPLAITAALAGERLFITGATGFVGKVLVEKLLWSVPEVGKISLLIRADGRRQAAARLREEILGSPVMARLRALHGEGWEAWAAAKVEAIAGDLARERWGLDRRSYAELCSRIDRVVACAATVRFDERIDRALELNTRGALRALDMARDAGGVPLLQVSTCFVSGQRRGTVPERLLAPTEPGRSEAAPDDPDATLAEMAEACERLRSAGAGEPDAEAPYVAAGAELAARHGFHDVYTLTKALAERLLERHRGAVPVAVVRPAIVESAAAEPIPGWIEGIRVADPLLVAYARGLTRQIPGAAEATLELVPVDFVANAILAALADLSRGAPGFDVYQVGSSRNPISLAELMEYARAGFARTPLRDDEGEPIEPRPARFVEPERFRRALAARGDKEGGGAGPLGRPRSPRAPRLGERLRRHFLRLVDVYRPYLSHGARYEDRATQGLWNRLSAAERAAFPFDVAELDWRSYIADVHVPGLVRFALKAETGAPPPAAGDDRRQYPRAAAERAAAARSVFDLFRSVARAAPDAVAFQTFRDGRWLRYTYRQALTATGTIGWRLATRYRVEAGDRVALWASGGPEWVLAMLALHRLGAVSVPLDPQWPAAEVEDAARFVGAKTIVAPPALAERLADSELEVVELASPFVPEPEVGDLPGAVCPDAPVAPRDLATIVFTSGTTVAPKAVPLTHGNLLANVRDLVPLMELARERLLSVLPIHHVFELMVGLLVPMAGASTISYVAEIKPAEISWMMATTRPTVLVAVPRLLELLDGGIRQSVAAGGPWLGRLFRLLFALSRLTGGRFGHLLFAKVHRRFGGCLRRIATGGSALEPGLGRRFQLMGFRVAEGYGMTETSPVLTVNPWRALRFGSVGRPLPGVEVDIRPPASDGAPDTRSSDAGGEIWVRGANVMSGYYRNPEATAEAMADGWLDTGDLGFFDGDGYLHISGRSKDVIVTAAGKNVYPEEVELRYRDLPGVGELVVLGLPANGRGGGERVAAVVVPAGGAEAGGAERVAEEIRSAIAERSAEVPSYQRITGVEIWRGELPKTTTLKVRRGKLRQLILAGRREGPGESPAAVSSGRPAGSEERPRGAEEAWIVSTVARLTRTREDLVRPGDRLADLGVDSLTQVELVAEIEARLGLRLDDAAMGSLVRVGDLLALAREASP